MDINKLVMAIRKEAEQRAGHLEECIEDAIGEVVDEYVAGLSYEQLCDHLRMIDKEQLNETLADYKPIDVDDIDRFLRFLVGISLEDMALSAEVPDSADVPSVPMRDSELQVWITADFDVMETVKGYVGEDGVIDLGSAIKLPAMRKSYVVIQFLGQRGDKRKYRIYVQNPPQGIDVRRYFVNDENGAPKRHYKDGEQMDIYVAIDRLAQDIGQLMQ